ncbi:Radical SAM domain protein [Methanothermus fervidus DSM 2088]|uniref:Radical SAM domain protein n=1 Tax=Methanothermus fervidus (strain ATCC 43054 / DSM 2088 / JCM 10308 / V24 S) TaxID=523846 RepID=E3GWL5_METFV|nr:radical SAM protein [Methanothermus fervidus]ADP76829.1 Radical SAM domain protein [Methanothermus fervidus DSM 2088]
MVVREHNVVIKNPKNVSVRFAICYPNVYKVAMSSLGFHILYNLLNSREDVWCERIIYPYSKSLESGTYLKDFDIVSFTVQYEEDYFNVLKMLKSSGIKLDKSERDENDPLIIAGGPCLTSNPLPMSKFIDLFVIGEGEEVLNKIVDTYLELENPRKEIDVFGEIEGVYIPDKPVRRVIVKNMDKACHPIYQIVPETKDRRFIPALGHSFLLGVSRGCTRGCRFCMTGYIYRPRRETSLGKLIKIAERGREVTNLNKISLIGSSVSDYSKIEKLCESLFERNFKISMPSLRIDSLSNFLIKILAKSGTKTITLAPESTWNVRKILNKTITDEKVFEAVQNSIKAGLKIKMYFLVGVPGEDIKEVLEFMQKLLRIGKYRINFSVNPLIPKAHTPFQWVKFDFEDINKKIRFMKKKLRYRAKFGNPKLALIQYVLSIGGKDVGELLERSVKSRISFREWMKKAKPWNVDDELPWKNIDVGLRDDFILEEYYKMKKGEITPWCEEGVCYGCQKKCLLKESKK